MTDRLIAIAEIFMASALVVLVLAFVWAARKQNHLIKTNTPKGDAVVEAGTLHLIENSANIEIATQDTKGFAEGSWSNNDQMFIKFKKLGESLTWELPIGVPGYYEVSVLFGKSYDYGTIALSINGKEMTQVNLYSPFVTSSGPIALGTYYFDFKARLFSLKLVSSDPKALAPHFNIGFDGIGLKTVSTTDAAKKEAPLTKASAPAR